MAMDFSLTVFWSICKVMYNFGEKIKKNKKKNKKKKKNKQQQQKTKQKKKQTTTFFKIKSDLNVIFGQVFLCWCDECGSQDKLTLKKSKFHRSPSFYAFLKHYIFIKMITDFENRHKSQVKIILCAPLDFNLFGHILLSLFSPFWSRKVPSISHTSGFGAKTEVSIKRHL